MKTQRIEALRAMLQADPDDTFALYGLGIELKTDAPEDAEALFRRLLQIKPDELYGYYQLGELLIDDDRADEARPILEAGIRQARTAGETKATNELIALLDTAD